MKDKAQLPDWARIVLDRVDKLPDEAALLSVVQMAESRLEALVHGHEPDRFEGLIAFCSAILASPLKEVYSEAHRKILGVRGVAEAQTFEQTGDIEALRRAVADLSAAVGEEAWNAEASATSNLALARALFRLGEQSGDLALLQASIERFHALPPVQAADPITQCTCAVVAMTIGGVTGDRQMVERAILDLQSLSTLPGLEPAARAVIVQNLAVSLLKNAEQCRSERVYSEVLQHLASYLRDHRRTPEAEMLRLVQAMARYQFAKLTADVRAFRRTELELGRLLKVFAQEPRRLLELLHLLGQTRFFRARLKKSIELTESAIASLRQALNFCGHREGSDARRDRLNADLAYYVLEIGLLSNSSDYVREAQQLFEKALGSITIERAPGLYIQVAKGLFELHYRQQAHEAAVAVAESIDRAARFARADPRLSSGVLAQAPIDVLGVPDRHALCLVRLGRLTEASIVLENARGTVLAAAIDRSSALEAELPADSQNALQQARSTLTSQLRDGKDVEVRRAWEDYLTLRRKHGLDLNAAPRGAQSIAATSPPDGALVQISMTPGGSYALVWTKQLQEPMHVKLSRNAWQTVSRILHGASDGQGWIAAYQRYLDDSLRTETLARQAALDWSAVVAHCLESLWASIFQPLEAALCALGIRPDAPLILCPQGEVALLPLCAAVMPDGNVLSDRWDVSIAPNALAVGGAQQDDVTAPQFVCLHSPDGDGDHVLPLTRQEAVALLQSVPQMIEVKGAQLNSTGALAAMKQATHLHVACHGVYEANNPSRSGLVLAYGERLTLTRLWAAGFDHCAMRLVFLSCCEGGMTGRSLDSDEFTGLPAAFLQLGVRAVIAAQWAVYDDTARVFSDAFYRRYLNANGMPRTSPACALGETRGWMRTVTVATLIDDGYLSLAEASEFFGTTAMKIRRLRRYAGDEIARARFCGPPKLDGDGIDMEMQPYAPACHWAGWTIFGR